MILIQLIGAIGYTLLALSYFQKEKKQILFMQIFSYMFFTIHYYLLSGVTGAICNFIGLISLIILYFFDKYDLRNKLMVSIFFISLILTINILTFQNIYSIFPMIALTVVIGSFTIDDENIIRGVGVVSAISWLIYSIVYKSYISIIFNVITLLNVFLSLFKNNKIIKYR